MFYYIYYKLYKSLKKVEQEKWAGDLGMAAWNTMLVFSILVNMNLVTGAAVLRYFEIIEYLAISKGQGIIMVIITFSVNYFLFVYKKKYLIIEERFDKLSDKKKSFGTIFFVIYFLLTIIALFTLLPLLSPIKN